MKFLLRLVLLVVLVGLLAAGYFSFVPFGPSSETFVDIPQGAGSAAIASKLEQGGVIRSRYAFLALRRIQGGTLHAGEYRFDHPVVLSEVYKRLLKGDVYTRTLVIPEGFNLFDIAGAVQAAGLGTSANFLAAARRDTRLISDLSPAALSLEGYLFPDTYKFSPHATPDMMVAAMVKRFRVVATQLNLAALPDPARTVIMASLIEKEVRNAGERPVVAGVFENRLARNMPLQTDPSVIYAAELVGRWRGTIYQSDLQSDSAYNTYKHAGLPPGPIANRVSPH